MNDGRYVVLFNQTDPSGNLKGQNVVGSFSVGGDKITKTDGICAGMLPFGPISQATELRINYGLNNAYYEVQSTIEFQPKAMKKSTGWKIRVKGRPGWHDVSKMIAPPPGQSEFRNVYVLENGDHIPQDFVDDLEMPGLNEPYEKLNRSLDARVNQEVARIKVDTSYKAPGLAGYDWSGDTVYIDKRLPTHAGKIPVHQFLIVHEVVEKTLIDRLGYGYKHAHHIALRAERRAVEMAGYDWNEYDRFMQKWIRAIGEEKVPKAEQPPNFEVSSDEKPMHRNAADPLGKTDDGRRVACVGVWDGRRLLLGRRNDNGKWTNPGGHLQPGENPNDGAKRELYEETGLMTDTLVHLGSQKVLDAAGKPLTVYAYMYSGHPDSSTTQMDPDEEVQSWQWIDMKDGVPPAVANDLHVPIERNLLLQKLGLVAMKKSEQLKKDAVLSDTDAAAPGHMQFTYTQNPRRMGDEPAKYGELATQNGPHPDKPTQKTIIRKSWLLPFAERMVKNSKPSLMAMLKKADRPNQVEIDHPWEKEGGVPRRVRTADPETARNHELFVDSNLKRTIAKVVPASHRKLFGAMAYYLRRHPTRHVRTVWETPQDKPDGQQVPTMRLRHLKAYMHGDAHIQMQFAPDHILITDHQPHGAASMGKPQWRFSKKGMEFAGYAE
jgi:8-oxo-dGTP pyrophosphatase MutT (NUDIX family)